MPGTPLREVALLFLRLGFISFGGPAAHVALMEHEIVRARGWLSRQQFLDYLSAVNFIPGPNSTELAIHTGRERAGWAGLVMAGVCFILPSAILVTAIAWAYVEYGALPAVDAVLRGIKPVVIAIVAHAVWRLAPAALPGASTIVIAVAALTLAAAGVHELVVLGSAAVAGLLMRAGSPAAPQAGAVAAFPPALAAGGLTGAAAAGATAAAAFGLWPMFLVFLKIGSVLFGSGYVLLAFLRGDFVERLGWITEAQLIDAVAVGQMTPGPVFTSATFVGYLLGGWAGALLATVGIFLPAFVFVALSGPLVPRLRRSRLASGALDAVNAAALALIVWVAFELARSAIDGPFTAAIALIAGAVLVTGRANSAWLIAAGAVAGWTRGQV